MPRVVSLFLPFFPTDRIRKRNRLGSRREAAVVAAGATAERPLATVGRDGSRRILLAVDAAAAALGLRPGLPVAQAQACVPGLDLSDGRPDEDRAALAELAGWCLRYSPAVEPDGPDGIRMDVAGASHLQGGEADLLVDLLGRLRRAGFAAEAAIAGTPGAAWALARHRPGTIVPPDGTEAALAPLPVASLRLEPETARGLVLLGIERVGDLGRVPRGQLARRFGPGLVDRLDRVLGRASEPITPLLPVDAPQARLACPEPLGHLDGLAAALDLTLPVLCAELAARGEGLRQLDALFRRVDGCRAAIRVGTAAPTRAPAHLRRLLAERLPGVDPGFGIDEVVLVASRTEPVKEGQVLAHGLLSEDDEGAALAPLVDRLAVRLGAGRVFRLAPVESRVPERSVRPVPPLAPAGRASWPADLPRPSRLVDPPEPVTAMAVVPDAAPASFVWRHVRHVVRAADGPERVRGEWWLADGELASERDYYRVEDTDGRRFWLFRDAPMAAGGQWWLQGWFA